MIKEYCEVTKGKNRFILRFPHYGHSLAHILNLYREAEKDFGQLDSLKVDIIHYAGERYKGTWGIEFELNRNPPEEYKRVYQVEATL